MDPDYARFAAADATFYDDPARRAVALHERFDVPDSLDWTGWERIETGHWTSWRRHDVALVDQGWKIHVAATPIVASHVLERVADHCHRTGLAFKHLANARVHRDADAKDADRTASGKFITIYPSSTGELERALHALDGEIGLLPGPRVLTDLQWRNGPLSVRYGSFTPRTMRVDGREVAAILAPSGRLVEDVREPRFAPPRWAGLPEFLAREAAALGDDEPPAGFPRITGALHHSNGGGIYEAEDGDGTRVVVKEARPHAGLTPDGRDAVARLHDEEFVLRSVAGEGVVGVRRGFTLFEHRYLVLDRVDGQSLTSSLVPRHPLIRQTSTADDVVEYREWALGIAKRIEQVVERVHDRGFSHGDLHPGNVIVTPEDDVVLLDFEMAKPTGDRAPSIIGAVGFTPPDRRGGVEADLWALGCIQLHLFLPLTATLGLSPTKVDELLHAATDLFDLDAAVTDGIRRHLGVGAEMPIPARPVDAVRAGIVRALHDDADLDRADRVWPGDPRQFAERGYGVAHGAAGVLHALTADGTAPDERVLAWIDEAVARDLARTPRLGLLDGIAGVADLYHRLGLDERADRLLDALIEADPAALGTDLYGGASGVGLVLLDAVPRRPDVLPHVDRIAAAVRDRYLGCAPAHRTVTTGAGGLLRGASGAALFALRRFERTGDPLDLETAEDAIAHDLTALETADDGTLQINEGWRLMPYLGAGSAGVGLVLAQLIPHSGHADRYLTLLDDIRRAACAPFAIESGLFQGRAGLMVFLAALRDLGLATPESDGALRHHVRELRLHAVARPNGGLGFAGQGLQRLSCDLATGSAGVLLALDAVAARRSWSPLLFPSVPLPRPTPKEVTPDALHPLAPGPGAA